MIYHHQLKKKKTPPPPPPPKKKKKKKKKIETNKQTILVCNWTVKSNVLIIVRVK